MLPWFAAPIREAAAATALADIKGAHIARERRDGWLKWLTTSLATNVGAVHKLTKPAAPPHEQDPEKELEGQRAQWAAVWGRIPAEGVGPRTEHRDLQAPDLPPLKRGHGAEGGGEDEEPRWSWFRSAATGLDHTGADECV